MTFPRGFFWGCATSAHQIEGGNVNDWSEWEKSHARTAHLRSRGHDPKDFISGAACESYVQENADIDCLHQLGANAYRFSIEWSRIEPEEGAVRIGDTGEEVHPLARPRDPEPY